jgi:hypothetical protein
VSHEEITISEAWAKPNQNLSGSSVNLRHEIDLVISFRCFGLVNAQLIYPKPVLLAEFSIHRNYFEKTEEILAHKKGLEVYAYCEHGIRRTPGI